MSREPDPVWKQSDKNRSLGDEIFNAAEVVGFRKRDGESHEHESRHLEWLKRRKAAGDGDRKPS